MFLDDGREFPHFEGQALSWDLNGYTSWHEEQRDYQRMRCVIRAMIEHRPAQLERERRDLLKASLDRMFGHNARKVLAVLEQELAAAKLAELQS
jgi:hypothetical protein